MPTLPGSARLHAVASLALGLLAIAAIGRQTAVAPWLLAVLLLVIATAALYLVGRATRVRRDRRDEARRQADTMADLHLATIEALALAIDAKDQTGRPHIRRMQDFAAGVARGLGMSENEIQGVKTAALLHDIGKLAVPEHILSKPGPLTKDEFRKIRAHPQIGAEIIGAVPFPYPVAPLILSHHERWDGKGYPQGLTAHEIPLGARILAVVDNFDALTSDRPYHQAMTQEGALALVQQEAGRAFDPTVVQMFVTLLPRMLEAAGSATATPRRRPVEPAPRHGRAEHHVATNGTGGTTVFEDIALAHREVYALYDLAQALGTSLGVADTMTLISSKLSSLVPFSSCALFLDDETTVALRCRFATGAEADVIGTMTVPLGEGLTGWVGRNRRPLVNVRPTEDFDAAGLAAHATTLSSALVAPLTFGARFIGTLAVYHTQPDFYSDDHRRLLDRVCEQAAAVIHHSMVFEQTQRESLTDSLTGLPNTRYMVGHFARELARAARLDSEVALLVMDLDNFKTINDSHGHHVGDRALCEVAAALKSAIRPYDVCARYAGDEFIILLSGCGADEAERKRIEVQRAVDHLGFELRGHRIPLAMSVGSAIFPQDGDSYEALLATADGRMYRDKTQRRHRAESLAATGKIGG